MGSLGWVEGEGKKNGKLGFFFMAKKSLAASNGETRHEPPRGRRLVPPGAHRQDEPGSSGGAAKGHVGGEVGRDKNHVNRKKKKPHIHIYAGWLKSTWHVFFKKKIIYKFFGNC